MSASLPEIPDQIRALASEVAEVSRRQLGETTRVIWFGSWVKGQAVPRSDLDLAIDAGAPIEPRAMADLRAAYRHGWIDDESAWLAMLEDRNLTSRTYDEELAAQVYARLARIIHEGP